MTERLCSDPAERCVSCPGLDAQEIRVKLGEAVLDRPEVQGYCRKLIDHGSAFPFFIRSIFVERLHAHVRYFFRAVDGAFVRLLRRIPGRQAGGNPFNGKQSANQRTFLPSPSSRRTPTSGFPEHSGQTDGVSHASGDCEGSRSGTADSCLSPNLGSRRQ